MVISSAFAGSTFFLIKDLLIEVDSVMITAYRFLGAGTLLLIFALVKGKNITKYWLSSFVLGLLMFIFFLFQNIGLEYTSASQSSFLTGLFVIFVPFLALLIEKEKLKFFHILVTFISGVGLWLVSGGPSGFGIGDLLSLIAGFVYALFIVVGDRYIRKQDFDVVVVTTQQFLVIGFLSLVWVAFSGGGFGYGSTTSLYKLIYLIVFPSLISFGIINWVQQYLPAFLLSVLMTMTTVFGVLMAWNWGGENFGLLDIIGGFILVLAILLPALQKLHIDWSFVKVFNDLKLTKTKIK